MDELIQAKKLSCQSGYKYLIKDVTWRVEKGERWIVYGLNGSGKTTLLNIVAGFQHYTHGNLSLFGQPVSDETIIKNRQRIGWVSGSFFEKVYQMESVLDIILSGKYGTLGVGGYATTEDVQIAHALLKEFGIHDKIDHPFVLLSKGQRQIVLICRALIGRPDILVLDEPCNGLDVYAREKLLSMIEHIAKTTDMAMVYVTHYTEEILDIFTKSLMLRDGRVYAQGNTETLFEASHLAEFLGHELSIQSLNGRRYVMVESAAAFDTQLIVEG